MGKETKTPEDRAMEIAMQLVREHGPFPDDQVDDIAEQVATERNISVELLAQCIRGAITEEGRDEIGLDDQLGR